MNILKLDSPLAPLTLAEEDGSLVGLWLEGQKYSPDLTDAQAQTTPVLLQAADWLERYFSGQRPDPGELPLAPKGSAFRQEVWQILLGIPYGETTTYARIAREVAKNRGLANMSAQAVGGAVGHNPISVIIPCHRVLGTDGSLTGYAGGMEKKEWLLNWERETK